MFVVDHQQERRRPADPTLWRQKTAASFRFSHPDADRIIGSLFAASLTHAAHAMWRAVGISHAGVISAALTNVLFFINWWHFLHETRTYCMSNAPAARAPYRQGSSLPRTNFRPRRAFVNAAQHKEDALCHHTTMTQPHCVVHFALAPMIVKIVSRFCIGSCSDGRASMLQGQASHENKLTDANQEHVCLGPAPQITAQKVRAPKTKSEPGTGSAAPKRGISHAGRCSTSTLASPGGGRGPRCASAGSCRLCRQQPSALVPLAAMVLAAGAAAWVAGAAAEAVAALTLAAVALRAWTPSHLSELAVPQAALMLLLPAAVAAAR